MDTSTRICKKCLLRETPVYPSQLLHLPHLRLLCRNARRHNPPPLPGYSSEMVKIDPNEENRFAALRTVCFKQNPTKARSGRADSTGQTAFCWCF